MTLENIKTAGWICILLGVWSWANERDWQDKNTQYTKELERVVATCLSAKDQQIWIGDELYLCSATPTGISREI